MKKIFFAVLAIISFAFTSYAQTTGDGCISDFTIELDGVPITANGVTTYQIVAKPKLSQASAISSAAGCTAQWVPLRYAGGGNKQFCDNYFPQIYSLTLALNHGNFVSKTTTPNLNGFFPCKKGEWYSLHRVIKNCKCNCLNSESQYNFRLDANNKLEVCKVQ